MGATVANRLGGSIICSLFTWLLTKTAMITPQVVIQNQRKILTNSLSSEENNLVGWKIGIGNTSSPFWPRSVSRRAAGSVGIGSLITQITIKPYEAGATAAGLH